MWREKFASLLGFKGICHGDCRRQVVDNGSDKRISEWEYNKM